MNYYAVCLIAVCEFAETTTKTPEIHVLAENRTDAINKATKYYYENFFEDVDYVFPEYCHQIK